MNIHCEYCKVNLSPVCDLDLKSAWEDSAYKEILKPYGLKT